MSIIIRLQNLPWSANSVDIRRFFSGLSIPEGGVHIVGGEMGDSFIAFSTDEDARLAMAKDGGKIKDMQIKLLLSSRTEMMRVIEQARQQNIVVTQPHMVVPQPPILSARQQPPRIIPHPPEPDRNDRRRGRSPSPRLRSRDRSIGRDRRRSPDDRRGSKRDRSRSPARTSRGFGREIDRRNDRFKKDDRHYDDSRYRDDRRSTRDPPEEPKKYPDADHVNSRSQLLEGFRDAQPTYGHVQNVSAVTGLYQYGNQQQPHGAIKNFNDVYSRPQSSDSPIHLAQGGRMIPQKPSDQKHSSSNLYPHDQVPFRSTPFEPSIASSKESSLPPSVQQQGSKPRRRTRFEPETAPPSNISHFNVPGPSPNVPKVDDQRQISTYNVERSLDNYSDGRNTWPREIADRLDNGSWNEKRQPLLNPPLSKNVDFLQVVPMDLDPSPSDVALENEPYRENIPSRGPFPYGRNNESPRNEELRRDNQNKGPSAHTDNQNRGLSMHGDNQNRGTLMRDNLTRGSLIHDDNLVRGPPIHVDNQSRGSLMHEDNRNRGPHMHDGNRNRGHPMHEDMRNRAFPTHDDDQNRRRLTLDDGLRDRPMYNDNQARRLPMPKDIENREMPMYSIDQSRGPQLYSDGQNRGQLPNRDIPDRGPLMHRGIEDRGPPMHIQDRGPPIQRDIRDRGPSMQRDIHDRCPPMQRDIQDRGQPMQRDIQERGPPMQRDIQDRGPLMQRDILDRGPPMQRDIQDRGPPMQRDVQGRGPPTQRNIQDRGPPTQRNIQDRGPPTQRNIQDRNPPMQRDVQDRGLPMQRNVQDRGPSMQRDVQDRGPSTQRNVLDKESPMHGENQNRRNPVISETSNRGPVAQIDNQTRVSPISSDNASRGPLLEAETQNKRSPIRDDVSSKVPSMTVEVKGMTPDARIDDVLNLFHGIPLPAANVRIEANDKGFERAFIRFTSASDFEEAINRNRRFMQEGSCELVPCAAAEFDNAPRLQKPKSETKSREDDLTIQLRGLPFACKDDDVVKFFDGLAILDLFIELSLDGRASGIGYVEFGSEKDFRAALAMNGKMIAHRYITVSVASKDIMTTARGEENSKDPEADEPPLSNNSRPPPSPVKQTRPLSVPNQNRAPVNAGRQPPSCIFMTGLPECVTNRDIADFLGQVSVMPRAIHIMLRPDKMPSGEAYAEFATPDDMEAALQISGKPMAGNFVSVEPISFYEMSDILGGPSNVPPPLGPGALLRTPNDAERPRRALIPRGPGDSFRERPRMEFPMRGSRPLLGIMDRPTGRPSFAPGRMRGPWPNRPRQEGRFPPPPAERGLKDFGSPGSVVSIKNLHFRAGLEELLDFFQGYNITKDNIIRKYNENGQTTGEARVSLPSQRDAQKVVRELNQKPIMGRPLTLSVL